MDEIGALLLGILTLMLGIVLGTLVERSIVNNDCESYGKFATNNYVMVCTKK